MKRGYVRLWRKSLDAGLLKKHKVWTFFTYCLLKASHQRRKVIIGNQEVIIEPGQFIFGRRVASEETGLSQREIRTCLQSLINLKILTIKSTNKFSIITIINWHIYQALEDENDQQSDQVATSNRPQTRIKECKEEIIEGGKSNSKHKIFQDWWFEKYEHRFKKPYIVTNWKQFGGQVKKLLKLPLSWEDLQYICIEFLLDEDPFILGDDNRKGAGHNMGMLLTRIGQNAYRKYLEPDFREANKGHIIKADGGSKSTEKVEGEE